MAYILSVHQLREAIRDIIDEADRMVLHPATIARILAAQHTFRGDLGRKSLQTPRTAVETRLAR